jgi:predicted amidohydrolase YtcJ
MTDMTVPYLGRSGPGGSTRSDRWRAGALAGMGSDWPVSTGDVMDQMSVAMRRRPPGDDTPPVLTPGSG